MGKFGFVAYRQEEMQNVDFQKIHYESEWNYGCLCNIGEIMSFNG